MAQKAFSTLTKIGIGVAIAGSVVQTALYNVDGGHRAVIFDRFRGVQDIVVGEGTHFLIPWVQKPIIFDCRSRPRNVPVITGSKVSTVENWKSSHGDPDLSWSWIRYAKSDDGKFVTKITCSLTFGGLMMPVRGCRHYEPIKYLQNVNITLRILFRPQVDNLPKIFTNLGIDYDERVLPSITTEVLKAVVAQFDAGELITQREIVSNQVSEELTDRANQFGLILDDISLTHLTFGTEFTQAVELKQVAQQDAERARYLVEKEEQKKKATVIIAEGDSKASELLAKALGDAGDGLVELRKLEAAEDIAYQLSRSRNVVYLPSGQQTLLSLPQ